MYERKYKKERILVICSFHKEPLSYHLPRGYDRTKGQLLLDNYIAEKDMEAVIHRKGTNTVNKSAQKQGQKGLRAGTRNRLLPYEAQVWAFKE